jgi:hypothetical protein
MKIAQNSTPDWLLKYAENAEENAPKTYKISNERMRWLQKQVDRLNTMVKSINKRGAEFGSEQLPPIEVKIINPNLQIQNPQDPDKIFMGKEIQITGRAPQVKGWKFVATVMPLLDDQGNQSNVVKAIPGAGPIPEKYRTATPECDFCKMSRRRNETYLMLNEATKQYKQIGRNCLAKFLNTTSPESVADLAEAFSNIFETLDSFEEEFEGGLGGGGGWGGERGVPVGAFVANTIAIQRAAGWVSRSKAREDREEGKSTIATADLVWDYMTGKEPVRNSVIKYCEKMSSKGIEHRPEDVELAKKVIQWTRDLRKRAPEGLNDYLASISSATSVPFIPNKLIGYVASIVSAYERSEKNKGFFKGKVTKRDQTEQGTTAWSLKSADNKDYVWFDAVHDPKIEAEMDKALAEQKDVYLRGGFERVDSYSGQGMTQIIVDKFLTPEEYAEENKEAIAKELAAQEKLKTAPQIAAQQKTKMTLTVDRVKFLESDYGTKTKYELTDDYGRKFFWMTTGAQELEEGKTYEANVTVGWEKQPGVNAPKLYCPEHPDSVLLPLNDPKKKNKAGICPIDQKLQDKPLRKLSLDKYTTPPAIRLDKVEPISVGGQQMISKEEINTLSKQKSRLDAHREALTNSMRDIRAKLNQLLEDGGLNTYADTARKNLPLAKQYLAREIQRAESSPPDQPFVYDIGELKEDHTFAGKFYSLSKRDVTPQEVLEDIAEIRVKHAAVAEEIKKYAPEVEALYAEFVALDQQRGSYDGNRGADPEYRKEWKRIDQELMERAVKVSRIRSAIERRLKDTSYGDEKDSIGFPGINFHVPYVDMGRNEYSFDSERAKSSIGKIVAFLKNPQPDLSHFEKEEQAATKALSGEQWSIPRYNPGIKVVREQPVLPKAFLDVARPMLASILEYEKVEPTLEAEYDKLQAEEKQVSEQSNQLRIKIDDMVQQRQRGKGKTAAWIKSIIKKA